MKKSKRRSFRTPKERHNPKKTNSYSTSETYGSNATTYRLLGIANKEIEDFTDFVVSETLKEIVSQAELDSISTRYESLLIRLTNPFSTIHSIHSQPAFSEKRNYLHKKFALWKSNVVTSGENQLIDTPESVTLQIQWHNINFMLENIVFTYNSVSFQTYHSRSLPAFNQLKSHLSSFYNSYLEILISPKTQKVLEVKNADFLDQIFDRLEIEQALTNIDIKDSGYLAKTFLVRWSNAQIFQTLVPESRSLYLKHLCETYWPKYRIIPVREYRRNESNNAVILEDAFLFPIQGHRYIYILWESVEDKRATYVFRCLPSSYNAAVQKVFDYVVADSVTNKRDRLRDGNVGYFKNSIAEYCGSLNHNNLDDWKRHVGETCR